MSDAEVVLRRAVPGDLDALIELRRTVAAEGIWIGAEVPLDEAGDRAMFSASIADGETQTVFVAEVDGVVVGSLGIRVEIGIADLGMNLAGEHRGRGVGRRLMEAAIEWARTAGAHKIALQHWPWNHQAHRLYERCGFVEEGYLHRHYRRKDGSLWDAVVMGLVLDDDAPGHDRRATDPPR